MAGSAPFSLRGGSAITALGGCLIVLGCSAAKVEVDSDDDMQITPPDDLVEPLCTETVAPAAPARLLTRAQYNNTVRDLLGDATLPASEFPPESTLLGFENNSEVHQASPLLVEDLMQAAEGVATRALAQGAAAVAQCPDGVVDAACASAFVQSFGLRAFRRPLTENEAALFDDLLSSTAEVEGYERGIELVLQAFLQSPQFLYRLDSSVQPVVSTDGVRALGPYEMASRLSYFLWGSMPDEALLTAAAANELSSPEQLRAQAERLLADPRAQDMVADFHRQWLGLDRLASVVREVAPGTEQTGLGPSFRESLLQFVRSVYFSEGSDMTALFGSPSYFVDAQLAPLYGLTAPTNGYTQFQDESGTRMGLLTQPALLTLLAHENQSAPILRGAFIREQVLCQPVPAPPPTVDNTPPKPNNVRTTRERFEAHALSDGCASCHALFDDLGFALENYDQLGRHRFDENGTLVDASGEVTAAKDPALNGAFSGPQELFSKFAESSQVSNCMATQWYRYAMGHAEGEADACSLYGVQKAVTASGGNLRELLLSMVESDAFRYRAALPEELMPSEAAQ